MKVDELMEAFQAGDFPESPAMSDEFQQEYKKVLDSATKVADVSKNYTLYKNNEIYMLVRNDGIIVGMLRLRDESCRKGLSFGSWYFCSERI
jgi:predicted acetyltransferase